MVDLAFLPAVAFGIGVPLVRSGESRNLLFLPLLAALWAANFFVHAELLDLVPNLARKGIFLGLDLIVLLIVIMGGRVIPFFTERALPGVVMKRWSTIEWLSPLSVMMFLLVDFLFRGLAPVCKPCRPCRLRQRHSTRQLVHPPLLARSSTLGIASRLWLGCRGIFLESRGSSRSGSASVYYSCIYGGWYRRTDSRHDGTRLSRPHSQTPYYRTRHGGRLRLSQPFSRNARFVAGLAFGMVFPAHCCKRSAVDHGICDFRHYLHAYSHAAQNRRSPGLMVVQVGAGVVMSQGH